MAIDDLPIEAPVIPPSPPDPPSSPELETRHVLDINGTTIGNLSLPVGTSEGIWTQKLTTYNSIVVDLIKNILDISSATDNSTTTTSSTTASTIEGMTKKVTEGSYIVNFNGSIYTAGASAIGEFGIYIDGVLLQETRRDISCNLQLLGGLVTISLNSIGIGTSTSTEIQLDGTQTVDVRFRSTNGGTIGFKERVLTLIKVR